MAKYIDRDALADFANNQVGGITANHIMRFPTADVQPVKHGNWCVYICSECHVCADYFISGDFYFDEKPNFCPNCGAKMSEEE